VDRSTRQVFLAILGLLVVAALVLAFVGGGDQQPGKPDAPTVDGVVVRVASTGLASVSGFSLRTDDGRTLELTLARLQNGTTFPPGHLAEHLATSARIRVWYAQAADGSLDALWLEDLPVP
jgi:hypothetical protein